MQRTNFPLGINKSVYIYIYFLNCPSSLPGPRNPYRLFFWWRDWAIIAPQTAIVGNPTHNAACQRDGQYTFITLEGGGK